MVTEELENELRRAFSRAGAGIEIPAAARTRLGERDYHPRRMHRGAVGAVGAVAAVAAAGIAVPLAVSGGPAAVAWRATIRLDSYTFTMPRGYHSVHGRPVCGFVLVFPISAARHGLGVKVPKDPEMKGAASAAGGCVGLISLPVYVAVPGSLDPFAVPAARPVRVGGHDGLIYRLRSRNGVPGNDSARGRIGCYYWARPGDLFLWLRVPAGARKVRDLFVVSDKLTERELIAIIASGLA